MKQARKIEIPDNRIITEEQYDDYYNHAKNSCLWQLSHYSKNSGQIRQKLYDKGYIKDAVYVKKSKNDENFKKVNIVEEIIEYLTELYLLDDKEYAENMLQNYLNKGKGISLIKKTMIYNKKVDPELLEEIIKDLDIEKITNKKIDKTAKNIIKSSTYKKKENIYKKKQYLYQRLISRGYSSNDISLWIQNNLEE